MKASAFAVRLTVTLCLIVTFGCERPGPGNAFKDGGASSTSDASPASFETNGAVGKSEPGTSEMPDVVLMKFGATWCPPCRKIDRELIQLDRMGLPLTIKKIDVDEQPELAERYRISSIPRLILIRDGRKIGDKTGFMTSSELSSWIEDKASVQAGSAPKSRVQENPFFSE